MCIIFYRSGPVVANDYHLMLIFFLFFNTFGISESAILYLFNTLVLSKFHHQTGNSSLKYAFLGIMDSDFYLI